MGEGATDAKRSSGQESEREKGIVRIINKFQLCPVTAGQGGAS